MKAVKIAIRVLVLLITSTWGIFFGIIAPLVIKSNEMMVFMEREMTVSSGFILIIWLIAAVLGYLIPCFLMMLDFSRIAACFALSGTLLNLYVHSVLNRVADISFMYLPQIFITILMILYIFAVNPHYITEANEKRLMRLNAPAPSIIDKNEFKE
ncbi:MAG: hypothetical protein FWG70_01975 [Oscillospiraceae bacterium]|nr:hypothetical protein [Oscillospiraceae bacterium]